MSLNIIIVGGVAGGMSAATRARRLNEQASIIVLEKGGFISYANCGLPYHLAGRIPTENTLLITTPAKVKERFNIDARVNCEVMKIDRGEKRAEVLDHASGRRYWLAYDKLIIATGANPIIPPIENVRAGNVFLLRSMEDTRAIRKYLADRSPAAVAIVGAGFIGLEMAEAMRDLGKQVTLIEKAPHVLPPLDAEMAAFVDQELKAHEVQVIVGNGLKALHAGNDGLVNAVETEDGRRIPTDLVLLSIGVRPNIALAKDAGLEIGPTGGIRVDHFQRSNDPDIYAVGDVSEVTHGVTNAITRVPLAGPANRQGRLAGEHAATGSSAGAGKVLGSAIVQVFALSVGLTGLGEAAARQAKFDVDVAYVFPNDHAGYYPGALAMRLKLIYDRAIGKVLGAQAIGGGGVDKRIDVIATVLHFGGTIDDLSSLDLAYAPQFSSAKDPVHIAAMVAQNQRSGLMPTMNWSELNGEQLIDVRTAAEYARGTMKNAVNIPVDQLRDRLKEIDAKRPTAVFCQIGLRGYVATRILQQSGLANVRNLKGGYTMGAIIRPGERREADRAFPPA